ncbi:hypothetical protein AAIH60_35210, partial [Pseudomonas aeruginosa]|uniref:hypothetical protein n=1 Tax=Pseudomonas aeruginosa TaxID=287 RepID=UPI0031B7BACC
MWKSDHELFALMKTRLFTAVVGDILDTLGYMHQFVSPAIKPLDVNTVVACREADRSSDCRTKGAGRVARA